MSDGGALVLPADLAARLDRLGLEFMAEFLGRSCARHPERFEPLLELAGILTRLGRLEEGLRADERLVSMAPRNAGVRYNLACSLALLGRAEAALDALEHAVDLGYRDVEQMLADEDLASLRTTPRFRALVERLRRAR
jgi:Flp pilus assembly protein TadD